MWCNRVPVFSENNSTDSRLRPSVSVISPGWKSSHGVAARPKVTPGLSQCEGTPDLETRLKPLSVEHLL